MLIIFDLRLEGSLILTMRKSSPIKMIRRKTSLMIMIMDKAKKVTRRLKLILHELVLTQEEDIKEQAVLSYSKTKPKTHVASFPAPRSIDPTVILSR